MPNHKQNQKSGMMVHTLGAEVVGLSEFKISLDYIASSKQNKRKANDVNAGKKVL